MPFEKFIPPRKQKPQPVSLKRTGTIAFDAAFASTVGLDNASHVTLHYDAGHRIVGVKPASSSKEEGALRLSHRAHVCSVRARAFFDHYGVTIAQTQRFAASLDAAEGLVTIALPGRRGRPRKPR